MALSKVFGFAVIKGGTDLPSGYNEAEPFGFDKGENDNSPTIGPIFSYSINDVEANFSQCYTMAMATQLMVGRTLRLYAEVGDNLDLKQEDFVSNADWKKAFKIIEWVIQNQANIVNINPEDTINYLNYADEKLGAELINAEVNKERINTYIPKSFGFVPSTNKTRQNRIGQFTFQATIDGVAINFQLFLDADDFCGTVSEDLSKSIYVWWFEEITHDGKLDNEEMYENVAVPLFENTSKRNFKRIDILDTAWHKPKNPTDLSQGYEDEAVTRRFIIYSNFKPQPDSAFPVESRVEAVKSALIERFGEPGADGGKVVTDSLITQYPDLFTRNEVLLIPFGVNNSMTLTGGEVIQGMHPITVLKLINTAKRFGYSLQTEQSVLTGKSKSEVFFAGGETPNEGATNIFRFPILAIEKTNKTMYPISSRFPQYTPKYFDQNWPSVDKADQFQFLLIRALGAFEDKYTEEQLNSITSTVKFTVTKNDAGNVIKISFMFESARWIIDNSLSDDNIR